MAGAQPLIYEMSICFDIDNVTAIQCIQRQGMARSSPLLALLEDIFDKASWRSINLSAKYVPGWKNDWVDALSRFHGTSVEWQFRLQVFQSLSFR